MTADQIITILSASGLILVILANIFYNRHYRDAKEAQIASLKQLISPDVFEYFEKSRKVMEESIQSLKDEIGEQKKETDRLTQKHDATNQEFAAQLRSRTEQLSDAKGLLVELLSDLRVLRDAPSPSPVKVTLRRRLDGRTE